MGVYRSGRLTVHSDFENSFESAIAKLIDHRDDEKNKPVESIGFEDIEVLADDMVSPLPGSLIGRIPHSLILDPSSPKHEAAIKLQKVYKSFRTRRKLADCAVLIEQSWWKLLDFAELKHSSISFFDIDRHETAISRWSRARTRAAKVGKGLSKNGKAQKLALQHWLEAIDPRHRYGHNLHFYYVKWLNSQSKEPFFYWLDIGEGKDINLVEKCSRSKLQQQCIKYLGPMERNAYEVVIEGGKLLYKQTGKLLNTTKESKGSKWIFVLSTSRTLYVGKKKKGTFQHSSFLAGGATLAAGRIVAENGVLKAVWPHSGHYKPTPENFQDFISFLRENNVDLNGVELDSTDDEEGGLYMRNNASNNASEDDLADKDCSEAVENNIDSISDKTESTEENTAAPLQIPLSRAASRGLGQELTALEIPCKDSFLEKLMMENRRAESSSDDFTAESPPESPTDFVDGTAEEFYTPQLNFHTINNSKAAEVCEMKEETVPEESISQRINLHKETNSFQLGKQLSCNWSTGAGPRIGCLRDYPTRLQCHALEEVKLSPRSKLRLRLDSQAESRWSGSNLSCRTSLQHSSRRSSLVRTLTSSSF